MEERSHMRKEAGRETGYHIVALDDSKRTLVMGSSGPERTRRRRARSRTNRGTSAAWWNASSARAQ